MTHERRVVRRTIRIQDDPQTIPTGPVVAAQLRRDYPDDALALKLDLWIETEQDTGWPDDQVALVGTDRPVPEHAEHLATVVDETSTGQQIAWHLYRIAAGDPELDKRALVAIAAASQARHRREGPCWSTPYGGPQADNGAPLVRCQLEAGHAGAHVGGQAGVPGVGEWTWDDAASTNPDGTLKGYAEPRLPDPGRGRET